MIGRLRGHLNSCWKTVDEPWSVWSLVPQPDSRRLHSSLPGNSLKSRLAHLTVCGLAKMYPIPPNLE